MVWAGVPNIVYHDTKLNVIIKIEKITINNNFVDSRKIIVNPICGNCVVNINLVNNKEQIKSFIELIYNRLIDTINL
jgi:hypothetical protein